MKHFPGYIAVNGDIEAKRDIVANFSVEKRNVEGHIVYHLLDGRRSMEFSIVPDIGNWIYQFKVNGRDVLLAPESLDRYIRDQGLGRGNPLMAPFANRIDGDHYFFDGRKYLLNDAFGNFLRDPQSRYPIHGLLAYDQRWEVTRARASDSAGVMITSRLEFYKYPDLGVT